MPEELVLWQEALDASGPPLWIALALVAACLVAVGFALVAAPRLAGRRRVAALAVASALTVHSVLVLGGLLAVFREGSMEWALHGPPASFFCGCGRVLIPGFGQERTLTLLTIVLGLAVPGALLALARATEAPARRALLLGLAAMALSCGAMTAWLTTEGLQLSGYHVSRDALVERLLGASFELDALTWVPVVVGALALTALGVVRRRSGRPLTTSWRQPVAALGVLLLGAGAFWATRDHAADRHRRLSLVPDWLPASAPMRPAWLDPASCAAADLAPVIEITPTGARLDGRRVDPPELARQLETYRRNWAVLYPRERFDGVVSITAPTTMTWPELTPWLVVARDAGYANARFVFDAPRSVHSATLGQVSVSRTCAVPLGLGTRCEGTRIAPDELPARRWRDLGETLAEAHAGAVERVFLVVTCLRDS